MLQHRMILLDLQEN